MATPSSIEQPIANLEGLAARIDRRLTTLEQDVRSLREEVNARLDRLEGRIDRLIYWQLGLLGAISASILATVLTRLL